MKDSQPADEQGRQPLATAMLFLFWLLLFGLLIGYFYESQQQRENPNRQPELVERDGEQVLRLKPNRHEQFVSSGKINGHPVVFLLDTGASDVAIPAKLQGELGLQRGPEGQALTANGWTTIFQTNIDRLEIGNFVLYDVPASLSPGMDSMDEVLLGMSALQQINFAQRDGMLELSLRN